MVPVEECEDLYKEIPFLVDDEECEDIPKLQCTEVRNLKIIILMQHYCHAQVEEEVPIQVCTSIDIQRDVIISSKGKYVLAKQDEVF